MEHITFKEIFASLAYYNAKHTLIKTLIWLLIATVSIYIFYFLFSKVLYNSKKLKDKIKTDTRLPLALLWSAVSFMILFSILLAVLLYYVNFYSIKHNYELYLIYLKNQKHSLFPYLVCYLAVIIYYYFKKQKFNKNLKSI